jgi:ribosome biogenesis GTPase / thiamine phosphate phosphatase
MSRRTRPDGRSAPAIRSDRQWGRVVAAHGRHVVVEDEQGQRVRCHPRGRRSEAVVGDEVRWAISGDEGVVEELLPRRNLLYRQDEWRTKSFAANLDALLVLVACDPPFSESQLARAMIAAQQAGIPAWIGLNKVDLVDKLERVRARLAPYQAMGVDVVELSLTTDPETSRRVLQQRLDGRATLVLGPSGMGKSTLINLMVPGAEAQIGDISLALQSGKHTTTTTSWYHVEPAEGNQTGTALIDSPGFQEFGLHQVGAADLAGLMPDLAEHLGACRFYNCTHRHEPGCALRAAAEDGRIHPTRWRLYGELFDELNAPRPYG